MSDHPFPRESRSFSGKTANGACEVAENWAGGIVDHPLCDDRSNVGEEVSGRGTEAGSWCALLSESQHNAERTSRLVVLSCHGTHPLVI
jgi:hypothetical protein